MTVPISATNSIRIHRRNKTVRLPLSILKDFCSGNSYAFQPTAVLSFGLPLEPALIGDETLLVLKDGASRPFTLNAFKAYVNGSPASSQLFPFIIAFPAYSPLTDSDSIRLNQGEGSSAFALIAIKTFLSSGATYSVFKTAVTGVKAGTRRATALIIGDSTSVGEHGGTNAANEMDDNSRAGSWPNQFAIALNAAGIPATCNGYMGDAGYGAYPGKTFASHNPQLTFYSNWATSNYTDSYWNSLGGSPELTSTSGSYAQFNPQITFDTLNVMLWNTGGTVGMQMSGPQQNFTLSNDGGLVVKKITTAPIQAGNSGFFNSQSSTVLCVQGAWGYNSAISAVDVINAGIRGSSLAHWLNQSTTHGFFYGIAQIAPDITYIMPPINDFLGGTSIADITSRLTTLITECKKYGDVHLINAAAIRIGGPNNRPSQAARDLVTAALVGVATSFNIPFTDLENALGTYADNSAQYFDDLHPLASRYMAMGQKVSADTVTILAK